ncbi:MAG TPA: exodeoxyribonuclease VII large subunit [Gemmataceae bacterium]|nr:exodeoxyribonuclease VII large subunit [Gemmataceae bacterium]
MNPTGVPQDVKVLSIGELTRAIKGLIEEGFASVWATGEVGNLARPSSGHIYLTLKDSEAQLRAVLWRNVAMRLRFELREGLEVIVRGRMSVYAPRGEYQLVVEELQPKGVGAQELALRQLKEKLFRLGYFAPERKKPLPRFPRRIALVTSPSGAAVRDILEILARRWPAVEILICPVRVQGDGAAEEIAAAISLLNRLDGVDAMIVGRGGGSTEDLWAFNAECVAQEIFASRVPVISAVGHEIDLTIADLVADCRALTPSEAAERIVPHREELLEGLRGLEGQLRMLLQKQLQLASRRLEDLGQRRCFRMPLEPIRDLERRLDDCAERLQRISRQRLLQIRDRLQAQAARLETLSPLNVLARGYSLTRREADETVVRSPEQVRPGDLLLTRLQHGQIRSRVEGSERTFDLPAS